jgi:hypothetical protein
VKSLIQEYSIKEDVLNTVEIEIPSVDVKRPLLEYKYE